MTWIEKTENKMEGMKLDVVVHTCNPNNQETKSVIIFNDIKQI
jgi:hypothetical protein